MRPSDALLGGLKTNYYEASGRITLRPCDEMPEKKREKKHERELACRQQLRLDQIRLA
jgi:hypothetical protein